jgi:hypothetical protein
VAGWQRLDAIAELTVLGPAVHLGVAVSGAVAGVALGGSPAGLVVAVLFLASLARPIIYTTAAVLRAPAPGRAISAFLYLPVYTVWRLWIATRSILGSRPREWERTARHHAAGRSTRS